MSAPFLLAYVCFAAGIVAGLRIEASVWHLAAAAACAALSLRSKRYAVSLAAQALFLSLLGLLYLHLQNTSYNQTPLRALVREHEMETFRVTGRVLQTPEISDDFWVLRLRIMSVAGNPTDGVARVTISGDSRAYPVAGEAVETYVRFRLPVNFGAEGSFDYERYLRKEGVHVLGSVKSAQLVRITEPGRTPATFFSRLRLQLIQRIRRGFSARDAAVLRALWLDDRAGLNPETQQPLIDAGVFHVVAISGFHVAIVLAIGFYLLKRFISYRKALLALGLFLVFYFLLLEGRSAITRSFLLYLSFAFAALRYEKIPWGNALGLAALLQLVANPLGLFDAGYHLTYMSTAAIIFIAVPVCGRVRLPRRAYQAPFDFAMTALCVQLALAPYQAWTFHRIPLAALAANWIAIPVSSVLIAMGMAVMPFPFLQPLMAPPARALLALMLDSSSVFSGLWLWTSLTPAFPVVCGYYFFLCAALLVRVTRRRMVCALLAAVCFAGLAWTPHPHEGSFRIHVIDVGQGDAILLQYPDGTYDLVDGGGFWNPDALDVGQSVLLPYFSRMGVTRLNRVFLTHAHADHMNGLFSLLHYVPVGELIVTRQPLAEPGFQRLGKVWLREIRSVKTGDVIRQGGVALTVLAPQDSRHELHVANDDSLVMMAEYEGRRVLLTGDAERDTEARLTAQPLPRVDVLKAPHHGSLTSSTEALLAAVQPRMAIVSVGRNNWFGHPHPVVVSRYRAHHAMLYRTDRQGTIRVTLDASGVSLDSFSWHQ